MGGLAACFQGRETEWSVFSNSAKTEIHEEIDMAAAFRFLPVLCCFLAALALSNTNASGGRDSSPALWIMSSVNDGGCKGTIGECAESDLDLDSETNRRILQSTTRYISYGALARNNIPCSRRGASYYNCRAGAEANPYTRGCSAITLCRS